MFNNNNNKNREEEMRRVDEGRQHIQIDALTRVVCLDLDTLTFKLFKFLVNAYRMRYHMNIRLDLKKNIGF